MPVKTEAEFIRRIVAIGRDKDTRLGFCRIIAEELEEMGRSVPDWLAELEREVAGSPQSLDQLREEIHEQNVRDGLFDGLEDGPGEATDA